MHLVCNKKKKKKKKKKKNSKPPKCLKVQITILRIYIFHLTAYNNQGSNYLSWTDGYQKKKKKNFNK